MLIDPVATFRSPMTEKFGIPRQAGLASSLRGTVVFGPDYKSPDALRGLEGFDYIWLIWGFNLNRENVSGNLMVRPPRLGGNVRIGVFASRSPYRPNGLGLSSVKVESIDALKGEIEVSGADLADGTPIYDVKPYVEYADSHPAVRSGFVDSNGWASPLQVIFDCPVPFVDDDVEALREVLSLDPRPQYQDDPERIYGLAFAGRDVSFRVAGTVLTVLSID